MNSLKDNIEIALAVGCGKTYMNSIVTLYEVYCREIGCKLAEMKRIPRKLKKKFKKNDNIWAIYKEVKGNES